MRLLILLAVLFAGAACPGGEVVFEDRFRGKLGEGWSWIRENPKSWRVGGEGLEVRVEPGNMWGPPNNARNVLVRSLPDPLPPKIEISVTVSNKPTEQYEQVDLVWYYDDSHMVKIGQELVDGKLSVVMGREERDRTRTLAIIPLDSLSVSVRYIVSGNDLVGQFRLPGEKEWREAGKCDLPAPAGVKPRISLQFYQGPGNVEHWARVTVFVVKEREQEQEQEQERAQRGKG
jgi:regulation of enolase protein 1 (concanavalin A-like superfamily)